MNTVKSKKVKLLLLFVIIFAFFSRFFFLDKIPSLVNSAISQRFFSASLSVGSVILLYLLVYRAFESAKIALLSAMIFSILPWTIEQGRIVSSVNIALFFLLGTILLAKKIKITALKWIIYLSVPLILYLAYTQFWLFRSKDFIPSLSKLTNDMFILTSPDFLFFKNPTFWWGGVRETGILYLSFLPFLFAGFYDIVTQKKLNILAWLILILLTSAAIANFFLLHHLFL
ncbi:phospholipid carrier-dependent glycosyltransferase [Candidatus Gottesmanbacteria bacterium]|nr:phospholipid carrier-dependent glycosyltransferase [Candidatus Gottesmanbacteria bacterium]